MSDKIDKLEEGLKLIGLLTPESREKIVQAFTELEVENLQMKAELNSTRHAITQLQDRVDRIQDMLIKAGARY